MIDWRAWASAWPTRIGLGAVALATAAANMGTAEGAVFAPDKALAVGLAIGAWLGSELAGLVRPAHPQDLHLFSQACDLVTPDLDWLRDHDFGNSFHSRQGKGLIRIADEWRGPAYRFHDKRLAKAWSATHSAIDEFTHMLMRECGPVPSNTTLFTVKTHQDFQTGQRSERTLAAAADLNRAAASVASNWDVMVDLAIRRLGIAVPSLD